MAATRSASFRSAGPNGTTATATRMRAYWKGDGGVIGEFAHAAHRLERPLRPLGQAAAREHQFRHRARRLHAARPRLVQREAQRGQRREQPRRQQQQPLVELRRRRPDRRSGDHRAARAPEAQLARHAAAVAGRADAAGRRRARPHARRQQQRLLPGQRDQLADWTPTRAAQRAAVVRAPHDRAAARAPDLPAARFLRRAGRCTAPASRTCSG